MMNHKKKNAIILVAVSIAFVAIVIWIAWGNSALMVNEIKITNDKIPQSFEGFRIAQVSDLHNAELGKDNNIVVVLPDCFDIALQHILTAHDIEQSGFHTR